MKLNWIIQSISHYICVGFWLLSNNCSRSLLVVSRHFTMHSLVICRLFIDSCKDSLAVSWLGLVSTGRTFVLTKVASDLLVAEIHVAGLCKDDWFVKDSNEELHWITTRWLLSYSKNSIVEFDQNDNNRHVSFVWPRNIKNDRCIRKCVTTDITLFYLFEI